MDVSVCKKHTAFNVLVFLFLIVLFAAGGYGPFSAHGSVGHSQSQSVKEQLRRAETRDISVLTIQMHLKTADFVVAVNGLTLNRNFKESIQQLPITWDQNRYLSFVGTYGTHYQSQGAVGGNYKYAYSFDRASLAKSSLTESQRQQCLKIDAGASYGIPGAGVSAEVSTSSCEQAAKKVNREATSFTSLAEEYSMVTGGSPTQAGLLSVSRPTSKADWAAWISTIADNPALLNYKLRPIQGLLNPDTLSPEDNAELPDLAIKREHLERAIFIFFRNADATYQCRSCLLGFAYLVSGNCRCACWANAIIGENTGICDRGVVFQEWNDASTNGNGRPSETVAALTQAMNVNGVFKAVLLTTDFGTAGSRYPVWEHHGSNSPMEAIEAARQDLRDQGLNPDYWGVYYVDSFAERCPRERQTEQVRAWIGEYEQAPNHKAAWISKDCDSFYWASGHLDPGSAEAAVEQRNDAANYFQYGVSAGPECPESKMAPTVRSILAEYEASKGTHKAIALSRACDAAYWWRGADSAHLAIDNVLKDRPNFFLYDSTSGAELCAPDPIVPVSHFPSRGRRDSWSVFLDPKVEIMEDNCDKSTRFLAATSFSIGEAIVKAREYAATKTGHRYQIWRTSAPNPRCLRSQWDPALEAAYVSYLGAKIEGKSSIFWVDGFHCKENRSSENQDSPSKALNDIVFAMTTDSAVGDLHLQAGRVYDFTPGSWCGSNSSIQPLLEQFERFPNHKVAMVNNDCTKIYWWVKSYRSELAYAKLREAVQKIEGVNAKDFGIYRWSLGELCPVESFSPGIRAFWDGYQQLNNHKVFMLSFDCQAAYYYGGLASPETAETTAINSILLHNSSLDDFFIYAISGHSEGFCPESVCFCFCFFAFFCGKCVSLFFL